MKTANPSIAIGSILELKICGIKTDYNDLGLSDIVKQIYEENKNKYNDILKTKIDKTLKDYKVDNWVISNQLSTILTYNPDYKQRLEELLDSRIEEILDKI